MKSKKRERLENCLDKLRTLRAYAMNQANEKDSSYWYGIYDAYTESIETLEKAINKKRR